MDALIHDIISAEVSTRQNGSGRFSAIIDVKTADGSSEITFSARDANMLATIFETVGHQLRAIQAVHGFESASFALPDVSVPAVPD